MTVTREITALKESAYTAEDGKPPLDYRQAPADKSNMARYLFGGFSRCLYQVQKFQSDQERVLAVILERDAEKWFKPAKGRFQIFYRLDGRQLEYQPDFVAEDAAGIYLLEPKAVKDLVSPETLAKKAVGVE